jgi:hypothetical protein
MPRYALLEHTGDTQTIPAAATTTCCSKTMSIAAPGV